MLSPETWAGRLLVDINGISSRFTVLGRGEDVHYVMDASVLPPGITTNQAVQAISNAIQAWAEVTSLRFKSDGLMVFGQSPLTITNQDERIWILIGRSFRGGTSRRTGVWRTSVFDLFSLPQRGVGRSGGHQ